MALRDKSLFVWSFTVDSTNKYIPFSIGGAELNAIVPPGLYTLATLQLAIQTALHTADTSHTYIVTVDRTINGGLENRITIEQFSGSTFSLLFSSGSTAASSIYNLISFNPSDYTGATSYTNSATAGDSLVTSWYAKNYQPPTINLRTIGSVNIAADGTKEVVWWSQQQFLSVEFQFEPQANVIVGGWQPLLAWLAKGYPVDFTPEYSLAPNTYYSLTLEKSPADSKGLGAMMREQLPDFPFMYTTGTMEFRLLAGTY